MIGTRPKLTKIIALWTYFFTLFVLFSLFSPDFIQLCGANTQFVDHIPCKISLTIPQILLNNRVSTSFLKLYASKLRTLTVIIKLTLHITLPFGFSKTLQKLASSKQFHVSLILDLKLLFYFNFGKSPYLDPHPLVKSTMDWGVLKWTCTDHFVPVKKKSN